MTGGARVAMAALLTLVAGCTSDRVSSSGDDGDCQSRYQLVANAPSRAALKAALLNDVHPRVRFLEVRDSDRSDNKLDVNLFGRRHRHVMSVEIWPQTDGTWTAQQWGQCID